MNRAKRFIYFLVFAFSMPHSMWAYDWPIDHNNDGKTFDGAASDYKITEALGADRYQKVKGANGKYHSIKRYHSGVDISIPNGSLGKKVYAIEYGHWGTVVT